MRLIEEKKRLSESVLWQLQAEAYCQFGPQAWSMKGVPSYVTSNPYIASSYAYAVVGFLRDCLASSLIDVSEPIYIFDLGAGTGRFGYLFLRKLIELLKVPQLEKIKLRYIMTDIAEKNISFCQEHPYLRSIIDQGILDFAFFQSGQDEPLQLLSNKQSFHIVNPIILLANYFFDTVPQDLFRIRNGQLEEGLISISVEESKELDAIDSNSPLLIPHLHCSYSYRPIDSEKTYYSDSKSFNDLIKFYPQHFDNISFLFPLGALQTIHYFKKLSNGRLCLLAGDQGVCTDKQVKDWGEPKISLHGTFSIPVSYHALAKYFELVGGKGFLTAFPDPHYVVMQGVFGNGQAHFSEAEHAFRDHLDSFEPCDYWRIVNCAEKETADLSLEYMLLLIKLGHWDPMVFYGFFEQIRQKQPKASSDLKGELVEVIGKIWENFFPIASEGGNFVMNLGVLLFELEEFEQAMTFFRRAKRLLGNDPQLLKNIDACRHHMNK